MDTLACDEYFFVSGFREGLTLFNERNTPDDGFVPQSSTCYIEWIEHEGILDSFQMDIGFY